MEQQDINNLIEEACVKERIQDLLREATNVLNVGTNSQKQALRKTVMDYVKNAGRILGVIHGKETQIRPPSCAQQVIDYVRTSKKLTTLQKRVQSLKPIFRLILSKAHQRALFAIDKNDWKLAEKIVFDPSFNTLITLTNMNAADYAKGWTAREKRKSKKVSLRGLQANWREVLAHEFRDGQYRIPAIAQFLTGDYTTSGIREGHEVYPNWR